MHSVEETTCVVQRWYPFDPGPASDLRYDVIVQMETGAVAMNGVASDAVMYPSTIACTGAPPGTHHRAQIAGDQIRFYIKPIPTTINCEDIE
jgi:hypothetical protein